MKWSGSGMNFEDRYENCYKILCKAANAGELCPSNETLSYRLGYASISGPAMLIKGMEQRGMIRVERFQQSRIVTILKTGARTARPVGRAPHWRDRPSVS